LPITADKAHTDPMAQVSEVGPQFTKRVSEVGPWFSKTSMGKWKDRSNIAIVVAVLLFCLWKSFF
jgi:hypothetical protein